MTKKDFILIQDAINAAVNDMLPEINKSVDFLSSGKLLSIENEIRESLYREFAARLPYTADGFDKDEFRTGMRNSSSWRKIPKEEIRT